MSSGGAGVSSSQRCPSSAPSQADAAMAAIGEDPSGGLLGREGGQAEELLCVQLDDLNDAETFRRLFPDFYPVFMPEGLSDDAAKTVSLAWAGSTRRQFERAWALWTGFCESHHLDPIRDASGVTVVNWLAAEARMNSFQASWFEHCASAVSTRLALIRRERIGQDPLVCSFLTALRKERPNRPKYAVTFDVSILRDHFVSQPALGVTPRGDLAGRLGCLLYLHGMRGADMQGILVSESRFDRTDHVLQIASRHTKETRGTEVVPQPVPGVPDEPRLCAHCIANELLARGRRSPRVALGMAASDALFFSAVDGARLTTERISNLIKAVMRAAGVPDEFRPHALRSAGATRFLQLGYTDAEVRRMFRWSESSVTMTKHYNRLSTERMALFGPRVR